MFVIGLLFISSMKGIFAAVLGIYCLRWQAKTRDEEQKKIYSMVEKIIGILINCVHVYNIWLILDSQNQYMTTFVLYFYNSQTTYQDFLYLFIFSVLQSDLGSVIKLVYSQFCFAQNCFDLVEKRQ